MTPIDARRCTACGAIALPPALACHRCGARDLAPAPLDPTGTVHATTAIRVAMPDPTGVTPAVNPIAVVALDGGPFVVARLDEALADTLPAAGVRVRVEAQGGVLWVTDLAT